MSLMAHRTVLALALAACAPAARPPAASAPPTLYVPPLKTTASPPDSLEVRFGDDAAAPVGCFAVSRRTGAVACIVGQYGLASESGERRLTVLVNTDDGVPDVLMRVRATARGVELEPQSRQTLDTIMRDGDFVRLAAPTFVPTDAPRSFGGLTVELRREALPLPDGTPVSPDASSDLKVIVRSDALTTKDAAEQRLDMTDVLFENTLTSVACAAPSLSVRLLGPTVVLLERECRLEGMGEPEVVSGAWLCDSERARCD